MPNARGWEAELADLLAAAHAHRGLLPEHAAHDAARRLDVSVATVRRHVAEELRRRERAGQISIDGARIADASDLDEVATMLGLAPGDLAVVVRAIRRMPGWDLRHLIPDSAYDPSCPACRPDAAAAQLLLPWRAVE